METREQSIEEIVNKYEMTGAYISNTLRVEYKHYDTLAKQNMIKELSSLVNQACIDVLDKFAEFLVNAGVESGELLEENRESALESLKIGIEQFKAEKNLVNESEVSGE